MATHSEDCRDRHGAQRAAHDVVGDDIDVLLKVAVGVHAIDRAGDAGKRPVRDPFSQIDARNGDRFDHCSDRGGLRGLRSRNLQMRFQARARLHLNSPATSLWNVAEAMDGRLPN